MKERSRMIYSDLVQIFFYNYLNEIGIFNLVLNGLGGNQFIMCKKAVILIFVFFSISTPFIFSQSGNVTAGGNALSASGSVSFSVGQVFCSFNASTMGTITEGVQQPYEISVVTHTEEGLGIILECALFPNPVSDFLTLKIPDYDYTGLCYRIFNINGDLLNGDNIYDPVTYISMSGLKPGIYIIRIINSNKELKSFRIIKI
jgi:hypothetical protein